MANNEDNVMAILMEIKSSVAKLDERTANLNNTVEKADKAYSLAKENERKIDDLRDTNKSTFRWFAGILSSVVVAIILMIINYFVTGGT